MDNLKGSFFVFEGPDGIGKTTLINKVAIELAKENQRVVSLSFPGREERTLGKVIYEMHHDLNKYEIEKIDPISLQVLHIAAHIDVINRKIKKEIQAGCIVLLDRFWWSTYVYGELSSISTKVLDSLIRTEKLVWGDIVPTTLFLLDNDKPFRVEHEHSVWVNIRNSYKKLAAYEKKEYNIIVIENNEIRQSIRTILDAIKIGVKNNG